MTYIERTIERNIKSWMFRNKVIIVYGARRVGKTTLVRKILRDYQDTIELSGEQLSLQEVLLTFNPSWV